MQRVSTAFVAGGHRERRARSYPLITKNDGEPTSFTSVGSYADSLMAYQLIKWQLPRGFEHMKPSAGDAEMEGFCHVFKCLETSPLNSPAM